MRLDRKGLSAIAIAILAIAVVLFPPWRARAIRTTMRYAAMPGIAPSVLIDTLSWTLPFAPVYAPPHAALDGQRMQGLATRSLAGDTAAAAELRRLTDPVEKAYHAPETVKASGALWRDSILAKAGMPSITSYDLMFAIDRRWMASRLAVLVALGFVLLRGRRPGDHASKIGNRSGPNLPA